MLVDNRHYHTIKDSFLVNRPKRAKNLVVSTVLFCVGQNKDSEAMNITREELVQETIELIKMSGYVVADQLIFEPWSERAMQIIDGFGPNGVSLQQKMPRSQLELKASAYSPLTTGTGDNQS